MASERLRFRAVTPERWADFERLFETRGAPGYCWCMAWRATPEEAKHGDRASRKAAMQARICGGTPVGLLAYDGEDAPVAWCSVAPRANYRRLVRDDSPDDGIWSIACFFVLRPLRGAGVMRQLVAAAVRHARAKGAKVVEAYPVDADSPSYRFMGFLPVFAEAGFSEVGREGTRRHVMRLALRKPARRHSPPS